MSRTLVLNATFEPLCVVACRRAVVLILSDKAEPIAEGDELIRARTVCLNTPKVIRLKRVVRVPYRRRVALNRRALCLRDNHTCAYCGKYGDTMDHVTPTSRGGKHVWTNVVCACQSCNSKKADKTLDEARMSLRFKPVEPVGRSALVFAFGAVDVSWEPYLAMVS